jgi:TonB family C-terminal domain
MAKRIQLRTFHLLFRIFSYLADKSGGWSLFVRPKLVIGTLIVGMGVTGCEIKSNKDDSKGTNNQALGASIKRSKGIDSVKTGIKKAKEISYNKQYIEPVISCYDIDLPDPDEPKQSVMEDTTASCYVIVPNNTNIDENEPFIIVEQMPEFPNREDSMKAFINKHLVFPPEAIKDGKEGMVICSFIVNKDGSLSDIEVIRGIHPLLNAEAIRLIKSFPKWIPGKQGGKAVPVKFTLPIRFTLPEKKK